MGLIVTGMHRSGTSATARLVNSLGLRLDGPQMQPAPENPRGHFERTDAMHINDGWLASLGGSWWAPPGTDRGTWSHLDGRRIDADRVSLGLFDPGDGAWFVKDPRICLLLPLWDRLTLQVLPVVLSVRDPREVANSLRLRDGMHPRKAIALWFAYNHRAISTSRERPLLIVDYDRLVTEAPVTATAVGQFIADHAGVTTPLTGLSTVVPVVEPELRRSRRDSLSGIAASEVDEAVDAYQVLAAGHADPEAAVEAPEIPDWAHDVLDELRESYLLQQDASAARLRIAALESELTSLRAALADAAEPPPTASGG